MTMRGGMLPFRAIRSPTANDLAVRLFGGIVSGTAVRYR